MSEERPTPFEDTPWEVSLEESSPAPPLQTPPVAPPEAELPPLATPVPSVPSACWPPPAPPPAPEPPEGPAATGWAEWYLSTGGKVYGPYPAAALAGWLREGRVIWKALVSRGAHEAWRSIGSVPEVTGALPAAPSLAPAAAYYSARKRKDRTAAGLLGILLGSFGAHHWYLENWGLAVAYLLLSWTSLPGLLGIIEGILYLTVDEERFQRNYSNWFLSGP